MTTGLADHVIVVTGASSGIGRATALQMGKAGARLMLVARDEAALDTVAAAVRAAGGAAERAVADVAQKPQLMAALDAADAVFGRIDGLFCNAGTGGATAPLVDYPDAAFDEVFELNVKSVFWAMKRVLPQMIERRSGAILATGSLASERGLPMTSGYNASKHAVLGLVRSAAAEVAPHNVRVNALLPGLIDTRMLRDLAVTLTGGDAEAGLKTLGRMAPMGRVGTADEAAALACFLLSDAASYITGQAFAADGGVLGTIANGA
ncbi:MAG: SDR family oxidoreductase [Phenylobacterium sp.]